MGDHTSPRRRHKPALCMKLSGQQYRRMSHHSHSRSPQNAAGVGLAGADDERHETSREHRRFFDASTGEFAAKTRLPPAFFNDLQSMQRRVKKAGQEARNRKSEGPATQLEEQLRLVSSVRALEEKLAKAKSKLSKAVQSSSRPVESRPSPRESSPVVLSKEDYKNLVDLYFYTHRSRFDPESSDSSPTPTVLEDVVFKLSEDFAPPQAYAEFYDEERDLASPLKEIQERLKSRQLREIAVTRVFIDLLLDDNSSNAALFHAYQRLPQPGVAFLPRGVVRVLLQRMSTPWQKSEKSMIRYLSLIDDMQSAGLPISRSEWASAIYLAGRSFTKVTTAEVNAAFEIWRQMENEAGVKAHNVTFNILFDIAVRANKYPLAQMVLKEMHDRGLRLNRLGRVSIIYYHGLRGDGDAVRKAYRDFIDAGEIVDTLVLNCVIASLYNAQEPAAAEQIYERMKSLHQGLRRVTGTDGMVVYRRYPGPGPEVIEHEMASNHLKRVLLHASRLKDSLPENHKHLQDSMPLTPDHVTFRTMIAHHVNVSGNLNRVTVLMNDMVDMFGLPHQSVHYQLLFKGFALHGATRDPDAMWSLKRLNIVWDSCRNAIKEGQVTRKRASPPQSREPTLPSIHAVNTDTPEDSPPQTEAPAASDQQRGFKRMSTWNEFILDLAVFPKERRKHIERTHAELFDDEPQETKGLLRSAFGTATTKEPPPQGQQTYYALGDAKLDHDEGEYVLPSPSRTIDPSMGEEEDSDTRLSSEVGDEEQTKGESGSKEDHDQDHDDTGEHDHDHNDADPSGVAATARHQVQATRPLVCWLLRAYTRATGSRAQVEEVWNSVRKVWRPHDPNDRDNVVRVLRRCLRDCDRYGPPL